MCNNQPYLAIKGLDKSRVWAVGGQVRDALLGRPSSGDLDYAIVVEDAFDYARTVGDHWGADVVRFPSTRTYSVELPLMRGQRMLCGPRKLDFATTRAELYMKPGKFPKIVEWGVGIRKDLERRDFTVNSIAMNLHTENFVSAPHAIDDLNDRVLRVNHPDSFIDDPTRMLRMIRYAVSLDFTIHVDTWSMIDSSLLSTTSKGRIYKEMNTWTDAMFKTAVMLGVVTDVIVEDLYPGQGVV